MKNLFAVAVVVGLVTGFSAFAAGDAAPAPAATVQPAEQVTLPKNIVWETNNDDPLIGSPKALRGGTLNLAIDSYPLTLRLMGPNSQRFLRRLEPRIHHGFPAGRRCIR